MKNLIFIGLVVLLSCCTQQGKELIKQREGLLKSSWKEAGLDSAQLTTLMESNYFRLSSGDIKKYFSSRILLSTYLDDTTLNKNEEYKKLAIIDYLISYANAKRIEKEMITNEDLLVSVFPLLNNSHGSANKFAITVGLNYPERSEKNPYLIFEKDSVLSQDTLFYDGNQDCFVITPEKGQKKISGYVFVYNFLYSKRLAYPFEIRP